MLLKKLHLFIAFLFSILVVSCGEEKKTYDEATVKPKSISLKGDLKEYFEVVDQEYLISVDENSFMKNAIITVALKRTEKDFNFSTSKLNAYGTNGDEDYHVGFGIEIFNSNTPKIIKNATEGGLSGPYSSDDVIGLMKLGKGEVGYIRWSVEESEIKGLTDFIISSAIEKSSSDLSSEGAVNSVSTISDENWDAVLKSYEEYVDQYIVLMKKASKGDVSAMSEYSEMLEKAEEFQDKIENAGDDISAKQLAKFNKIQMKMINAASNM